MEIVTDWNLDFKNHYRVVFGSYVEAHDNPSITNNINTITHKCIELGPTGNLQGTHKVFCLKMGIVMNSRNIIPIIATYQVIRKLNDWCKNQK